MKPHYITTFLILSFFPSFSAQSNPNSPNFNSHEKNNRRRILHQPFFPSTSSPPPPPPPLQIPDLPDPDLQDPDHPFFHELPPGPPPPSPQARGSAAANLVTTQKSNQNKKLAIGITSGILTLAVLATLAFYIHKQRSKNKDESQKPFNGNSQSINQDSQSQIPPSNFLYIGTVEPSARSVVNDTNIAHNGSPYRKLNSGKRSNFYRPSPDLQPLPPLTKPPPSPPLNSPPPMSSSDDDESQETSFYTPNGSHSSKQSYNSKRTKPVIIPSIKQSMPYSYTPKRTKFSPPPPPPPPPPPGPPVLSIPRKFGPVIRPEPIIPTPKETPRIEKASSLEEKDGSKPKLKPLHWDKVRATSERATVWDQIKSSSFQLNEDAIETLFGCNSASSVPKEAIKKPFLEQEIRVLDPKKSQNIAILLRALNVTREEISEALLDGNPEGLGSELLETLVKMAPTKEEEIKLKDYNGEISKLGSAERFLKAILDIPFAYKRVEAMLYRANFDTEVNYLRMSFQTLEEASQELKNSRLFLKLLEAVLRTGNRMNDGTNRGDARAFKLDTLLKLVDVKGTDGKTTLLHFVVQEIIRADKANSNPINKDEEFKKQGLQVVSGLSQELGNVKKAAGMDSDVLSGYVSKLEMGLEKVKLVLQYEKQSVKQGKFFGSMKEFLKEAGEEISVVKAEERKALSLVKEATQYFHGDAAKEEAHPFRIFMIVRDFLSILDKVCRDVGRMQDRTTMGTGRSFRIPVTASLPVLNRYNIRKDSSSDGDSM